MAGNSNSGRQKMVNEKVMYSVINLSWERIRDILTKQGYTKDKKDGVALEIAKKTAPKNIEIKGDGESMPLLVRIIKE